MRNTSRIGSVSILFLVGFGSAFAQTIRVPAPRRIAVTTQLAAEIAPAAGPTPTAPSNLTLAGATNKEIDLTWTASTESGGTVTMYQIERCEGVGCASFAQIGTSSTTNYSDNKGLQSKTIYSYRVRASDANNQSGAYSISLMVTTGSSNFTCLIFPTRSGCMDFAPDNQVDQTYSNINSFYQTTGSYSFFNQIKSIYNGASGSATVSADLATLNFADGMQVAVVTNVQAGSSGTPSATASALPTLSASGAGQATQNVIYGGTFVVSELYPLVAAGASKWGSPGGVGIIVDMVAKEGADIQNFKSGSNVSVTAPPFHGSGQIEGYLQYNSINLVPNSQNLVGSLFLGGAYGYDYMSHGYAKDYGFGNQVSNGIGQVSFGILINGVAKITVSRAFGPSQTYIDSATTTQTTVNNFKAWSFGITYQSAAPTK